MAKIFGLYGAIRGRAGNSVFSKGMDGRTIVRAWQPTVYNPNTLAQRKQRAKVNLVGQLSGLCDKELLSALSYGTNRKNRAMFLSKGIKATQVTVTGDEVEAALSFNNVIFSRGAENWANHIGVVDNPTANSHSISVDLDNDIDYYSDLLATGRYGMRFVVAVISGESREAKYKSISYADKMFRGTGGLDDKTAYVTLAAPLVAGDTIVVWECPFVLNAEGMSIYTEGMSGDNTNAQFEAALLASLGEMRAWGDSSFLGSKQVASGN